MLFLFIAIFTLLKMIGIFLKTWINVLHIFRHRVKISIPNNCSIRLEWVNGWMGNGWTQCKKPEHVKNLLNVLFLLFVFHLNLATCCCCFSYSIKIHSIRQVLSNPFIQLFPSLMQTRYTNDAIRCFHLIKFKLTQTRKMREKNAF